MVCFVRVTYDDLGSTEVALSRASAASLRAHAVQNRRNTRSLPLLRDPLWLLVGDVRDVGDRSTRRVELHVARDQVLRHEHLQLDEHRILLLPAPYELLRAQFLF